jgi:hypothetical protein
LSAGLRRPTASAMWQADTLGRTQGLVTELGVLDLCVAHESKEFERNGVGDETMVREPTRREVIHACFRAGSVTASRVRLTLRTNAGAIAAR